MTYLPSQQAYAVSVGTTPTQTHVYRPRSPTSNDVQYPIGIFWNDTANQSLWYLASQSSPGGQLTSNWVEISYGGNFLFPITPFVVGPVGQAEYQTIQAGINAANAAGGGIVGVQPGTYTENLTLFSNCHVTGLTFADAGGGVNIIGTHTPPTTGGFVFNNVFLQSATNIFSSTTAGSAHLLIGNAAITVTNGYTFNLLNWTGKLEVYDVNGRTGTNDGFINNTGGSTVAIFSAAVGAGSGNTMTLSGSITIFDCAVGCPINLVTGASAFLEYNLHLSPITFSNNSTGEITFCEVLSQITMSSSAAVLIGKTLINTSSNPAIAGSGAGTLTLNDLTFVSNTSIANTLTIATTGGFYPAGNLGAAGSVWTSNGPGAVPTFQNISASGAIKQVTRQVFTSSGTYTPTANMVQCDIICLGGGAGGGGAATTTNAQIAVGEGGGGGEYAVGIFSAAQIGASKTVTVGAGGTAGSSGGGSGGNGGTTSVGSLITCFGGSGGSFGSASGAVSGVGGGGGTGGAGGDYRTPGYGAAAGFGSASPLITASGAGGDSQIGEGGQAVPTTGAGNNGLGYGTGGSGACNITSAGVALAGGAGASGIAIITEYIA